MSRVTNFCFFHLTTSSSSLMHSLSQWDLCERTPCLPAQQHYQSLQLCRQSSPVKIKHTGRLWIHTACRPAPCVCRPRSASSGGMQPLPDGGRWKAEQMDGQAEVQLPPGAPAPWAAPLPAPSSSSIMPVPSVIHMLCLQSLWREPHYLSCLTGERCDGVDSPITDQRSVASESLQFLALPKEVLKQRMRALICLLYGNTY